MSEALHRFIGDDAVAFDSNYVFFANLNLDAEIISSYLSPIITMICKRIESTYKSPAKISFIGTNGILKNKLSDLLQCDDICVKLMHVESGRSMFVVLGARLVRTLLIRLLATSLIDDSHGLLFSSTEKGIFSFIVMRLLFDLKNALVDKMPDLKLLGVYHCQDEAINEDVSKFGSYNFSFTFAADIYPVSIIAPIDASSSFVTKPSTHNLILPRCGHLNYPLVAKLITLQMDHEVVSSFRFGDLILFDHSDNSFADGALHGPVCALWHELSIVGQLEVVDNCYRFLISDPDPIDNKGVPMEALEIINHADDSEPSKSSSKILGIAKNFRVSVSIEISRLPMTLEEICGIKEGEIIDLHRKINDPLDIVVEGKVIGHCQPVQIDGRLGIRVLSMNSDDDAQKF